MQRWSYAGSAGDAGCWHNFFDLLSKINVLCGTEEHCSSNRTVLPV
jgi:hypothetical protein